MLAWRLALPLLKRALPLPRLVRLAARAGPGDGAVTPTQVVGASHRLFGERAPESSDCLERSLLTYRFLAEAGVAPELVWGLQRDSGRLIGHAWVLVGGTPVDERPEALERYAPVVTFDANGERRAW
jgi:Transglutaminase-like superfamily